MGNRTLRYLRYIPEFSIRKEIREMQERKNDQSGSSWNLTCLINISAGEHKTSAATASMFKYRHELLK